MAKSKIPTRNDLVKRYGSMIQVASDTRDNGLWLPSTFFALNYQWGGGIPFGKIIELAGEESSGKTLLALNFAYTCQQLGGHVIWVDAEQSWMNSWAEANGVDPSGVTVVNDTRIEYISDMLADLALYTRSNLTHNEPILLVIDSIAALDCSDNVDSRMVGGKAEMGGRAKALYKYFRIRNELFYKLGITQIYINQVRSALNVGFGKDPLVTTGGAALKFWSSIRSVLFAGKSITVKSEGRERRAGKLVTIRVLKNKVAPPRATISKCPVYFNPKLHSVGFDRYFSLSEALLEEGVIEKNSSGTFYYKGEKIARGEDSFHKIIAEDDDFRRKLMRKAGINTIATTKKKLQSIKENLYPVEGIQYESYNSDDYEDE